MTSSSHLASSTLCYLAASAVLDAPISIEGIAITAAGSLLPDIDAPTSSIGRPFYPIANWINQKIGHRTLTHSLVGLTLFGLAATLLAFGIGRMHPAMAGQWINRAGLLAFGYASHIFVDTLNKTGVELFWPAKLRCVFFLNDQFRIAAAGRGDYWFMTVCLVLNLAMYPLARDGLTHSLHQAFGDMYSVTMDFKQYGDKNRIWLNLEGIESISNQKIQGRFEILAVLGSTSVLIERNGMKEIVSKTQPGHLFPFSSKISLGTEQIISTQEVQMAGRTLAELPRFSGSFRVLFYGYVTPVKQPPLALHKDRFDPITHRQDKLKFDHAEYRDIQNQHLPETLIKDGVLIAKVYRSRPASADSPQISEPTQATRVVQLRIVPSDTLNLKVGETIHLGQVIGHHDTSAEIEKLNFDCWQDLQRIDNRLEEEHLRLSEVRQELDTTRREVKQLRDQLASAESEPLLTKERARISLALRAANQRASNAHDRITILHQQIEGLNSAKTARSDKLREQITSAKKHAELLSNFSGTVVRIESEAVTNGILVSVIYSTPDPVHRITVIAPL